MTTPNGNLISKIVQNIKTIETNTQEYGAANDADKENINTRIDDTNGNVSDTNDRIDITNQAVSDIDENGTAKGHLFSLHGVENVALHLLEPGHGFFNSFGNEHESLYYGYPIMGNMTFKILGFSYSGTHAGTDDEYTQGTRIVFEVLHNNGYIDGGTFVVIDFTNNSWHDNQRNHYSNYLTTPANRADLDEILGTTTTYYSQPELGNTNAINATDSIGVRFHGIYNADGEDISTPAPAEANSDTSFDRHQLVFWCVTTSALPTLPVIV